MRDELIKRLRGSLIDGTTVEETMDQAANEIALLCIDRDALRKQVDSMADEAAKLPAELMEARRMLDVMTTAYGDALKQVDALLELLRKWIKSDGSFAQTAPLIEKTIALLEKP